MSTSHWDRLYGAWARIPTPVKVHPDIVAVLQREIAGVPGRTLLLGVTAALIDVGSELVAIDRSEALLRTHWPGDTAIRRAVVGDWLSLPFSAGSFATCIGDGSPISFRHPDAMRSLYASVASVLRGGGKFVCRVFLAPDAAETVDTVATAAWRREIGRFLAFKFRLGMAVAAQRGDPNVAVQSIHDAFEANVADRDRLAAVTGWDRAEIDTIDVYDASSQVYSFPTRRQCLAAVPPTFVNARFVAAGSYELAERFPLLVLEKP